MNEAGAPFPRQDGPPGASGRELAAVDASCFGQLPNIFVRQPAVCQPGGPGNGQSSSEPIEVEFRHAIGPVFWVLRFSCVC